jgi:D-glycero-D-manno-heptose 1,7-bisphosphate phosphatase
LAVVPPGRGFPVRNDGAIFNIHNSASAACLRDSDICMKLIILDRDGVINEDSDAFVRSEREWVAIPGSLQAIARLNALGYKVAVATNQSGVARGYFSIQTLDAMHHKLSMQLEQVGGWIDRLEYCPHGPEDACECRKPRPGMLKKIAEAFQAYPPDVISVGDSLRDFQAAQAMGMQFALVSTGKGERTLSSGGLPDTIPVYADLAAFVHMLAGEPT